MAGRYRWYNVKNVSFESDITVNFLFGAGVRGDCAQYTMKHDQMLFPLSGK